MNTHQPFMQENDAGGCIRESAAARRQRKRGRAHTHTHTDIGFGGHEGKMRKCQNRELYIVWGRRYIQNGPRFDVAVLAKHSHTLQSYTDS